MILVVAKNDRRVRIEVGYGLEGAVPDAIAKRIIEEQIVPRFKSGELFGGISAGVQALIKVISGEPLPLPSRSGSVENVGNAFPILFILSLFIGSLFQGLRPMIGALPASLAGGLIAFGLSAIFVPFLFAAVIGVVAFLLVMFSEFQPGYTAGRRGYYGRGWSSGGSGWSGGGGGGGFSGGGGSFGGGGASGSW